MAKLTADELQVKLDEATALNEKLEKENIELKKKLDAKGPDKKKVNLKENPDFKPTYQPNDKVLVKATPENPWHPKDDEFEVTAAQATHFIKKGLCEFVKIVKP